MNLANFTTNCQIRLEKLLAQHLQNPSCPVKNLQEAMAYSVLNSGKRIRPLLVYATGYTFNAPLENCDAAAAAIELIHTYSLIHDDLPAMDNADTRRGKASCHKTFGEATAILAGDALQPLAFQIIAEHPAKLNAEQRLGMIQVLCDASGMNGMAAGQMLDMAGANSVSALVQLYQLKTGRLLSTSISLGLLAANENYASQPAMKKYAENIGLAFQLQDDLLDTEIHSGKPQGLDVKNNKNTYPVFVGVDKTQEMIQILFTEALSMIKPLGEKADLLRELAYCVLQRKT
jgi:geranylgeranyl pyrophosphate synthase